MNIDIDKTIFMSIKPIHVNRILDNIKNYEFRNYIPNKKFNYIYVYVTVPVKKIKYLIKVDNIVKYPELINKEGYGNDKFNKGIGTKYAYEITHIYKVREIDLDKLKNIYKFTPPQSFTYASSNKKLFNYLSNEEITKIR